MQIFIRTQNTTYTVYTEDLGKNATVFTLFHHLEDKVGGSMFRNYLVCNFRPITTRNLNDLKVPLKEVVTKDVTYSWNFAYGTPKYILKGGDEVFTGLTGGISAHVIRKTKGVKSVVFVTNLKSNASVMKNYEFEIYKAHMYNPENYVRVDATFSMKMKGQFFDVKTDIDGWQEGKYLFVIRYDNTDKSLESVKECNCGDDAKHRPTPTGRLLLEEQHFTI